MNLKLVKKLTKDFPHTFQGHYNGNAPFSLFPFECGDGWEPIIRKGAEKLEPLIVEAIKKDPDAWKMGFFITAQLKEKFGTMRWYLSSGTDEMYKITEQVELQSAKICEQCGKPGKSRGKGWLYTSCNNCSKLEDRDNLEYLEDKYTKSKRRIRNEWTRKN